MLDFDILSLADIDPRREVVRGHAEADNHTVHMGLFGHLAIPAKGAVGKVEMHTVGEEWFPKYTDTLSLYDGISRHKGGADRCVFHYIYSFLKPA